MTDAEELEFSNMLENNPPCDPLRARLQSSGQVIAALVKERDEALKQASLLRGQLAGLQGQLAGTSCPNCGGRINPQTACCDECTEQDEKLCNDNSEQRARIAALEKALRDAEHILAILAGGKARMPEEHEPHCASRNFAYPNVPKCNCKLAGGKAGE